ncbi:putative membrane protein [Bacteroides fragilis str. 1007-1-F |nr:putative membrane protein [Bacteroides fragilis str. 1007-1-F \
MSLKNVSIYVLSLSILTKIALFINYFSILVIINITVV